MCEPARQAQVPIHPNAWRRNDTVSTDTYPTESRLRSVLKALSYRALGTLITALIAYTVTGSMSHALAIGSSEPLAKLVLYYLHERAWQSVPRGRVRTILARR